MDASSPLYFTMALPIHTLVVEFKEGISNCFQILTKIVLVILKQKFALRFETNYLMKHRNANAR